MFVRTINAYSLDVPPGGTLKIDQSQSWLPVHRLWILTVGLLGRYARRADHGRVKGAPRAARIDQRYVESRDSNALSGITGTLRYEASAQSSDTEQGVGQVYFVPRDKDTRGSLQPDHIPFSVLFRLSMACVPQSDGRVLDVSRDIAKREKISDTGGEDHHTGVAVIGQGTRALVDAPVHSYYVRGANGSRKVTLKYKNPEDTSSCWVRDSSVRVGEYFTKRALLSRSDVICLALGIMQLEWSPRGSLFETKRGRFCRRSLCQASFR